MDIRYVPTICPYCSCGSGIYLVVKDGRIIGTGAMEGTPGKRRGKLP